MSFFVSFFGGYLIWPYLFGVLGQVLYACKLRRVGHYLMAMSLAPNFVKDHEIFLKCPKTSCKGCRLWTCPVYGLRKKKNGGY